jgi:predicted ATPase
MAYLSRLELSDFRAFRFASLDFDEHGLVLVTGPNNVGKSALLSALDVVAGFSVSDDPYANLLHVQGRQASVRAQFVLTDPERQALLGSAPETAHLMEKGAVEWLLWEFRQIGSSGPMQVVSIRTAGHGFEDSVVAAMWQRDTGEWEWTYPDQPMGTGSGFSNATMSASVAQEGILTLVRNLPQLKPAADVLDGWRASYFHFKPFRQTIGRATGMHSTPTLHSDGSNLAQVLLHLRNNESDQWDLVTKLIEEIVPNVGQLALPSQGNQFEIAFRDRSATGSRRYNVKDLGAGVEQLLMALVVGATTTTATVVLEEPENGLHAAAERALLNLLQQWSATDRLFIASTHSPFFLDWANAKVLAVARKDGVSTVGKVSDQRGEVLRGLGVRLSDVLAAERVLILEGSTDEQLFGIWFPEIIRNPRVAVINGEGGDGARHAELLGDWMDHADQLGGRKLLYVRDRDELPQRLLDKLDASDRVFVLPCRELENLLLDFEAIAAALNQLRGDGQPVLSATDIEPVARDLAEGLKADVVLKRVCGDLVPHRLMDTRLRSKLAKRQAGRDELIKDVVARLPTETTVTKTIEDSWKRHTEDIAARWDDEWLSLVPGADLLKGLWQKFLSRGYNKAVDGLVLARLISPPEAIAKTINRFISED